MDSYRGHIGQLHTQVHWGWATPPTHRQATSLLLDKATAAEKDQTGMNIPIAAPGGGPELPVWGQVAFIVVAVFVGIFVVTGLLRNRRR
ncbi:hypothetical protein ACFW6C_30410 [Streptomyces fungicidicus]|uniref:hypothetical protein n=1 Tax=Streptomyces fungicidicus TaxID=68203 RepID=UPI0033344764